MANDVELKIPDQLEAGVYANSVRIWHTRSEFARDFIARPANDEARDVARLVSRVKIPTIFMFELIRKLNGKMTDYERKYGEIERIDWEADDETEDP